MRVSGARIKQARLRAGMTQAQLARAAGVSERNVVRWENDQHSPRVPHLAAIAKATGVRMADLYDSDPGDGDGVVRTLTPYELELHDALMHLATVMGRGPRVSA